MHIDIQNDQKFSLANMSIDDIKSLLSMINESSLEERRIFNKTKIQILKILENI